jgi:hypothetical protein
MTNVVEFFGVAIGCPAKALRPLSSTLSRREVQQQPFRLTCGRYHLAGFDMSTFFPMVEWFKK